MESSVSRYRGRYVLGIILGAALLVRLAGITYGLPLWLVGDEPSLVFGALKMIELKTVLPVLHDDAFRGLFYYTPLLAYVYLLPFLGIIGLKGLFFLGSLADLKNVLLT